MVLHAGNKGKGRNASKTVTLLTPREREVLKLLADGYRTREVAQNLEISIKTVETHRQRIMDKLNCYTIAGLTKFAIREGLTTLED